MSSNTVTLVSMEGIHLRRATSAQLTTVRDMVGLNSSEIGKTLESQKILGAGRTLPSPFHATRFMLLSEVMPPFGRCPRPTRTGKNGTVLCTNAAHKSQISVTNDLQHHRLLVPPVAKFPIVYLGQPEGINITVRRSNVKET